MPRQVLVIQKAQITVDVPLLQYIDTTVDVPVAKRRREDTTEQHEDCITKYNEFKVDKKDAFSRGQDREREAECLRQWSERLALRPNESTNRSSMCPHAQTGPECPAAIQQQSC